MANRSILIGLGLLALAIIVFLFSAVTGSRIIVPTGLFGVGLSCLVIGALGVSERTNYAVFVGLGVVVAIAMPAHLWMISNAPVEATMGIAQKIFYYHVPSAYSMYVGFTFALIGSIGYLARRDERWDALAVAGAEVGMVFVIIVLITGPLWARKAWGTYWTWDPRLTSTMMIGLVFSAFVVLRSFGAGGQTEKRFAAGLAIVGSALIPIIHWSVQRWRGQHPTVVTGRGGGLDPAMYPPFFVGLGVFTLLTLWLIWARFRAERTKHGLTALADRMADAGMLEDA